jgi:hypothetical protein
VREADTYPRESEYVRRDVRREIVEVTLSRSPAADLASSPSARSRNADTTNIRPATMSQRQAPIENAAAAAIPVASLSVVRWFGVTAVFTSGRTHTRAARCTHVV